MMSPWHGSSTKHRTPGVLGHRRSHTPDPFVGTYRNPYDESDSFLAPSHGGVGGIVGAAVGGRVNIGTGGKTTSGGRVNRVGLAVGAGVGSCVIIGLQRR